MAILVEGISVIVRRDAIEARFAGRWHRFLGIIPNATLCYDDDLARVGFMSPLDVKPFIQLLEKGGLVFIRDGHSVDIAVVDQRHGPTVPADWFQFAPGVPYNGPDNTVAMGWFLRDPGGPVYGIQMPSGWSPGDEITFSTPEGWSYEKSLSKHSKFVPNEEMQEKLKFLRHEGGLDIYLDLSTGKEVSIGRPQV
jgi:hypothetical protein